MKIPGLFRQEDLPEQFLSTSGTATLDSLLPVQLDKQIYTKFKTVFHPRSRGRDAEGNRKRVHRPYQELSKHLCYTGAYFNALLAGLRQAFRLVPHWQEQKEDIGAKITEAIQSYFVTLGEDSTTRGLSQSDFVGDAAVYLSSMRSGNHHIILDSERFKGGKSILYVGARPSGSRSYATACPNQRDDNPMPLSTANAAYSMLQNNGNFDNAYGKAILVLTQDLLEALVGVRLEHSNVYRRSFKQLPVSTHFDSLFMNVLNKSILVRKLGARVAFPVFESKLNPADVAAMGDFFSILPVYDPSSDVVNIKSRSTTDDTQMPLSMPSAVLTARVGFSFAFDLPADIVSYITQSQGSERPSIAALSVWASMWSFAMLKPEGTKGLSAVRPHKVPMYVLMPSRAHKLVDARKKVGLYSEAGRCNEEGLTITSDGNLHYLPPADEHAEENSKEYEKYLEEALTLSFDAGSPLLTTQMGSTDKMFDIVHPEYSKRISELKKAISDFRGTVQAYNWDLNSVISVSAVDPDRLDSTKISGSTVPNAQNIVDYLNKPFAEGFYNMFSKSRTFTPEGAKGIRPDTCSSGETLALSSVINNTCLYYEYAYSLGYVPPVSDLVAKASKSLNVVSLRDEKVVDFEIDALSGQPIYKNLISDNLVLTDYSSDPDNTALTLLGFLAAALNDAEGGARSNLTRHCAKENTDVADDPHYFEARTGAMHGFSNVYNYFGGRLFYFALKHITQIPADKIQKKLGSITTKDGAVKPLLRFQEIASEVIPFARMMSTYLVDKREDIYKKAQELDEINKKAKVAESDIRVPGSKLPKNGKPGMQMLPHQAEDCAILANHPKFVIFDIAPGGGKCLVGSSLVCTSQGLMTLKEIWDKSDASNNVRGFQPYRTSVISHEDRKVATDFAFSTSGKTHKVVLSDGVTMQGLPEHRMWALNAGDAESKFVRLDELTKNHWLPAALGTGLFNNKTPVLDFNGTPKLLTEAFAEVLGWLSAEGYIADYCVHFEQHDSDMMSRYRKCADIVFGEHSTQIRNGAPTSCKFSSKDVMKFVRDTVGMGTSAFKAVPVCVRTAPKKLQVAYLRALFEGDGSIYHKSAGKNRKRVWNLEYCTISPTLAFQVKAMLDNIGVASTVSVGSPYKSNGHAHVKRVHILRVNWRDLPLFEQEIGFLSERKSALLAEASEHTAWSASAEQTTNLDTRGSVNRVPCFALCEELYLTVKEVLSHYTYEVPKTKKGSGGRTETWSLQKVLRDAGISRKAYPAKYANGATNKFSVFRLFDVVHNLPRDAKNELLSSQRVQDILKSLSGIVQKNWVHVESIRKAGKEEVFDLSVPGPHSYVVNGLYGHNTTEGIIDMGMIYNEHLIDRVFFVICPDGLVRNWVEDLHKHTEGRWNAIPVTSETYNSWGDARLTEMIQKAPRNTLVIVGNYFLSNTVKQQLVIGNAVSRSSNAVEFVKKFSPEYVLLDESQRLRNTSSGLHDAVKSICTMSSVKFIREATGTLIQNVMSDVVGQAAMCNGQIFRTKDEYDNKNKEIKLTPDGRKVYDYSDETPMTARMRLNEFATVLSHKQKDWAFMLPTPIETFVRVTMEDTSGTEEDTLGKAHRMFYDALLKKTMEELRSNAQVKKLLKGGSEAEDDADEDNDEDEDQKPASRKDKKGPAEDRVALPSGVKIDTTREDDDSDNLDALEATLRPYLQRLERVLTDPLGDPELAEAAQAFFGDVKREDFVTAKVRETVRRIKVHLTKNEWKRGATYKSSDLVESGDKTYILRPTESIGKSEFVSNVPPEDDPDNWKVQVRGKVLVICRYTRSVEAIMRALPPDLRKRALAFHGEVEGDKNENLNRYKTDSKIDILVCNETGISEGHNLQCSGRQIRVEAPWAPGELDQTAARMFRPDVEGKYPRETVFLDWIITDGSLEVAKMGRLISKMLKKTSFDELYNEKYYQKLNPRNSTFSLPIISMSLDNIELLNSFNDLCAVGGDGHIGSVHKDSYIGMYQYLVSEKADEFREMKKTKRAYMVDVTPTPMPEDAKVIDYTPWVGNLKVPDRHNDGLLSMNEVLQDDTHPITQELQKDPDLIKGKYVRTEFGVGVVTGYTSKRAAGNRGEDDEGFNATAYSKIRVELVQGGSVLVGASKLFFAQNVTSKSAKSKSRGAPVFGDDDKKRTRRYGEQAEEESDRTSRRRRKLAEETAAEAKGSRRSKAAKEDTLAELPVVELHPAVYNCFLALEAVTPNEADDHMSQFGFTKFGKYAYMSVKTAKAYNELLDWLEAKFTLDRKTAKFLEELFDTFQSGRGQKFDIELAKNAELPKFLQINHRLTKVTNPKKPELKIYPLIVHAKLFLVVDLSTNPVFKKYVGKTVPHTSPAVTIGEADGLDISFYKSKGDLVRAIKQIRDSGEVEISNYEEVKEEVKALDLKPAR